MLVHPLISATVFDIREREAKLLTRIPRSSQPGPKLQLYEMKKGRTKGRGDVSRNRSLLAKTMEIENPVKLRPRLRIEA